MIGKSWRAAAAVLAAGGWVGLLAAEDAKPEVNAPGAAPAKVEAPAAEQKPAAPRKAPAPLSENAKRGLDYLVKQQDAGGGWGQGGGWRISNNGKSGRVEGNDVKDPPDVGNTCIAALALLRSGSTPAAGPYANNLAKAVKFITDHVDASDEKSLYVTDLRDTQLQSKIGRYADTFLAGVVLSELKGQMPTKAGEASVFASLNKTIHKIEINQKDDGNFADNAGWASVLSQGLCSKALSRAKLAGVKVKTETLDRDISHTVAQLDKKTGTFAAGAGGSSRAAGGVAVAITSPSFGGDPISKSAPSDAGVQIYNFSANSGRLQDQVNCAQPEKAAAKEVLKSKTADKKDKAAAQAKLEQISRFEAANDSAVQEITRKLDDGKFIAGFGNNGGEEFLSYMNISETLIVNGGEEWEKWNQKTTENINRVQNTDGSWSGSHCITGRTFCTAAALLTLMADRAPCNSAVAAKLAAQK